MSILSFRYEDVLVFRTKQTTAGIYIFYILLQEQYLSFFYLSVAPISDQAAVAQ